MQKTGEKKKAQGICKTKGGSVQSRGRMTRKAKRTNHCIKKKKRRNREEGVSLDAREKCRNKVMTEKRCLDSFLFLFPPLFFFFSRYNREAEADQGFVVAVSARKKKKNVKKARRNSRTQKPFIVINIKKKKSIGFSVSIIQLLCCVCVCVCVLRSLSSRMHGEPQTQEYRQKQQLERKAALRKKKTHTYIHI